MSIDTLTGASGMGCGRVNHQDQRECGGDSGEHGPASLFSISCILRVPGGLVKSRIRVITESHVSVNLKFSCNLLRRHSRGMIKACLAVATGPLEYSTDRAIS